jgi:hypothetical protein
VSPVQKAIYRITSQQGHSRIGDPAESELVVPISRSASGGHMRRREPADYSLLSLFLILGQHMLVCYLDLVGQEAIIGDKVNVDGLGNLPGLNQETDALPTGKKKGGGGTKRMRESFRGTRVNCLDQRTQGSSSWYSRCLRKTRIVKSAIFTLACQRRSQLTCQSDRAE